MSIERVAVLGAGVMGAGIAAQVANAGAPVLLLDVATEGDGDRSAGGVAGPEAGEGTSACECRGRYSRLACNCSNSPRVDSYNRWVRASFSLSWRMCCLTECKCARSSDSRSVSSSALR